GSPGTGTRDPPPPPPPPQPSYAAIQGAQQLWLAVEQAKNLLRERQFSYQMNASDQDLAARIRESIASWPDTQIGWGSITAHYYTTDDVGNAFSKTDFFLRGLEVAFQGRAKGIRDLEHTWEQWLPKRQLLQQETERLRSRVALLKQQYDVLLR